MNLEIQTAKLLSFDQASGSWLEIPLRGQVIESPTSSPSQSLTPFVIATWNIWEENRFTECRHPYILWELFSKNEKERDEETLHKRPSLDVITLQEVTPEFFGLLLAHPPVRAEWILTDLTHQLDICPNPYGTVILIRKSLLRRGYTVTAGFHEFENTRMQRGLNFVELFSRRVSASSSNDPDFGDCVDASQRPIMRIGTSHFESHPEDKRKRREQFEVSAEILTSKESYFFNNSNSSPNPRPRTTDQPESTIPTPTELVPAILTGDCNICSYDELDPLLNPESDSSTPTFIDAFLAARPIEELTDINSDNECESLLSLLKLTPHPTFGVTFPNRRTFGFGAGKKKRKTRTTPEERRLDYIFTYGLNQKGLETQSQGSSDKLLLEAGLFGDEPVCEKSQAEDEEGRDGRVYASDHLGVWIRVHVSPSNSE